MLWKMLKKFYKGKLITGMNGVFVEDATVYTFGPIQQLWNFQMDLTVGSDLYSMENWPQCTPAAALKMAMTVQVCTIMCFNVFNKNIRVTVRFHTKGLTRWIGIINIIFITYTSNKSS